MGFSFIFPLVYWHKVQTLKSVHISIIRSLSSKSSKLVIIFCLYQGWMNEAKKKKERSLQPYGRSFKRCFTNWEWESNRIILLRFSYLIITVERNIIECCRRHIFFPMIHPCPREWQPQFTMAVVLLVIAPSFLALGYQRNISFVKH